MSERSAGRLGPVILVLVGVGTALASVSHAPDPWTVAALAGSLLMGAGLFAASGSAERRATVAEREHRAVQSHVLQQEQKVRDLTREVEVVRTQDEVSGTLSRTAFLRRVDEALQRDSRLDRPLAFLLLDVENFRAINEAHGRVLGDEVLRAVARAISSATRGTDFVGRIGGDEFGVVLGECSDPRPAVDRLFVALAGASVSGLEGPIRASIGAVLVEGPSGVEASEIFRSAEGALASVRGNGGGACGKRVIPKRRTRLAAM